MRNQDKLNRCLLKVGKDLPSLAAASSTRVMGIRKDGKPAEHRGTALLCSFNEQQAFITANHVLEEIERVGKFSGVSLACLPAEFECDIHRFPDIDIAVILPRGQIIVRQGKVFWPAENADRSSDPLLLDYLLTYGFPGRFAGFSTFIPGYYSTGYSHNSWVRPRISQIDLPGWKEKAQLEGYPPVPDDLLRPGQFAMNFAEDTGPLRTLQGEEVSLSVLKDHAALYEDGVSFAEQKSYGPYGLSGSPVWRVGAIEADWSADLWSTDMARLAGIVTDWNEGHHVLIATPMLEIVPRLVVAILASK